MKRYLAGAVALAAMGAGSFAVAEDIKIGVLYPTSGGGAIYGGPAMVDHNLAVDEINAAGGINGHKLVTVARDSKLNPAAAASAAKEMVTKDGVNVRDQVKLLKESGLTIILAEQNLSFILYLSDTVHILEKGEVKWSGTGAALKADKSIVEQYLTV